MKVIDFSKQQSVINQYVRELRDVELQKDRLRFRHNVERIGHAMAYEVSKSLSYSQKFVETPLAVAQANTYEYLVTDDLSPSVKGEVRGYYS